MHSTELTVSVQRTNIKADYSFACVFIILETYKVRQGNVTSLYMPWGASERTLGNSLKPNQKDIRANQGKRAKRSATKEATPQINLVGSKKSSNELGYPHTEVGRPAGGAVCEC